jgi:hypothetical protein
MLSALLLSISIVALSQFAVFYGRAVLAGVAAQPVSDRVLVAAQAENGRFTSQDFQTLAGLHELTLELNPSRNGLGLVRSYYRAIESLDAFLGKAFPAIAMWSERERVMCAQYAAVQVDRRLHANLEFAASMRSC